MSICAGSLSLYYTCTGFIYINIYYVYQIVHVGFIYIYINIQVGFTYIYYIHIKYQYMYSFN